MPKGRPISAPTCPDCKYRITRWGDANRYACRCWTYKKVEGRLEKLRPKTIEKPKKVVKPKEETVKYLSWQEYEALVG